MFDVCALVATLHRPGGLTRALQTLRDTTPDEFSIVVAIDPDDTRAREIAYEYGAFVAVCNETRKGPAYAWNTALAAAPHHFAYVLAADDLIFKQGWYEATLDALSSIGNSGMVGFNDGRKNADVITHYLLTRDFIINHNGGVMCCPHYRTVGPDTETHMLAMRAHKFVWAKKAMVLHDWHGADVQCDDTYKQAKPYHAKSKATYYRRLEKGFPVDWEPILRGEA